MHKGIVRSKPGQKIALERWACASRQTLKWFLSKPTVNQTIDWRWLMVMICRSSAFPSSCLQLTRKLSSTVQSPFAWRHLSPAQLFHHEQRSCESRRCHHLPSFTIQHQHQFNSHGVSTARYIASILQSFMIYCKSSGARRTIRSTLPPMLMDGCWISSATVPYSINKLLIINHPLWSLFKSLIISEKAIKLATLLHRRLIIIILTYVCKIIGFPLSLPTNLETGLAFKNHL